MNKKYLIISLFCLTFVMDSACAQPVAKDSILRIIKTDINAESENAELCIEFDRPLATLSSARLANALRLQSAGKKTELPTLASAGTSLCLFPLQRGVPYRLDIAGLRGVGDEKMEGPYKTSFTIPDRSPMLNFTGANGGVNGFDFYDHPLTLRAVNVPKTTLDIYRIGDNESMARAWQERAESALAPTESVYLAKEKGKLVWHGQVSFDAQTNITREQRIDLQEKIPELSSGLYLIVADFAIATTGIMKTKPASKGLTPLAAAWFTKADFSLQAMRDGNHLYVFGTKTKDATPKSDIQLFAVNAKNERLAESKTGADGISLITLPTDKSDVTTVIGIDRNEGVAFADALALTQPKQRQASGIIETATPLVAPWDKIEATLSLADAETKIKDTSLVRLMQKDTPDSEKNIPAFTAQQAKISLIAPATTGISDLRWQKNDGTLLGTQAIIVSDNPDMPRLEVISRREAVNSEGTWPVTVKSVRASGQAAPLISGHASIVWHKIDAAKNGGKEREWKDYVFGTSDPLDETPISVADFVTDLQGEAQIHPALPKGPQNRGLYQAELRITPDADSGISAAAPVILPLRPETTLIGIKALATDARFPQNGIARFALIGLGSDGKPHDVNDLSYQLYEEGRNFSWFQDEGRWKYKQAAQLRPIGGGDVSIKSDGSSILEWPVTAGNYRLEILDGNGKPLTQTSFSAGWDSTGAVVTPALPLDIKMSKALQPGREAVVHITLPEAAMVTALITDGQIRKTVHETHSKGDMVIRFTPTGEWQENISIVATAQPAGQQTKAWAGTAEATLIQSNKTAADTPPVQPTIITGSDPALLDVQKNDGTTLVVAIANGANTNDTYRYSFTLSPGLKAESTDKGNLVIPARQSKPLSLAFSAIQGGEKEIRLDITGPRGQHISRVWPVSVRTVSMARRSDQTWNVEGYQNLFMSTDNSASEITALVSRRPMDGLAEILSFVLSTQPFTTVELATTIDALRLWRSVLSQTGMASATQIDARRRAMFIQMLRHQNSNGGFSSLRGGESTIDNTAAALTALGNDNSEETTSAKRAAIAFINQHLSNTWVDEKERSARASAYAALAAADAIDTASLHYFSDTSAPVLLPAIAEAHIAAAFKKIKDPNAAAFWIKKMLNETTQDKNIAVLRALAATDALSSDDVQAAMRTMKTALQKNSDAVSLSDAAMLLYAIAIDNADAGKGHFTSGRTSHDFTDVAVIRGTASALASYRNNDKPSLSVTQVSEDKKTVADNRNVARHIYRMNGVELSPSTRLMRDEYYIVELKGTYPESDAPMIVQDSGMHPVGCPLSSKMETLSFIPWLSPQILTNAAACEYSHHTMNILLPPANKDNASFTLVYVAQSIGTLNSDRQSPRIRGMK